MMMKNGSGSVAAGRSGFADRTFRWADRAAGGRDRDTMRRGGGAFSSEEGSSREYSEERAPVSPSRPAARQQRDAGRVKRLAAVSAASVAVAFTAVSYGVWTSASSRAAVDEATAGAASTLVAAGDIRAGDAITSDMLEERLVPRSFRVASALGGEALEGEGAVASRRALVDIAAGEQITPSLVTGAEGSGRLAAELLPGMEAVTVSVDAETGVAGQVRAYDAVRIVSAESASSGASLLETVCAQARVVAVGEGADEAGGRYASVTVEVSPDEADAVREAQYAGKVSLILIASEDALGEGGDRGQVG